MKNERGTADLLLLAAILAGTLIGAQLATTAWTWLDGAAGHFAAYGAAIVAGVTLWRRLIQPIRNAIEVILKLDHRVGRIEHRQVRIEKHLGLEPVPVEADEA